MSQGEPFLAKQLALLVQYLPQLREAGVLSLRIDDIEVTLRPLVTPTADTGLPQASSHRDPATMGLASNVKVPSLRDRHG